MRTAILILVVLFAAGAALADEPGHIQVTGPAGIEIRLDGKSMGTTSDALGGLIIQDVPPGKHTLTASKDGYKAQVSEVVVTSGQVLVHKLARFVPKVTIKEEGASSGTALRKQVGCLVILTLPVKAMVDIPSAGLSEYAKTRGRITASGVPVGSHPARFQGLGKTLTRDLEVRGGWTTNVLVNFATGLIKVTHAEGLPEAEDAAASEDGAEPAVGERGAFEHRRRHALVAKGTLDDFQRSQTEALRWLAAHQDPNGRWGATGFSSWCHGKIIRKLGDRPDGLGKPIYDVGVTGLALCAFLAAGYSDRGKHPYVRTMQQGMRYLKSVQDKEGCFGARNTQTYLYSHATATLAMVEAYGLSGSATWRRSAQLGLDFIAFARNPESAWRYGIKPGSSDTSASGWMIATLHAALQVNEAARRSGKSEPFRVDKFAFKGMRAWLDRVTDPDTGRVGYVQRGTGPARPQDLLEHYPPAKSEAMTAVAVYARILMGESPSKSRELRRGATLCSQLPPRWDPVDGSIDMYYWYYGTLAMYQAGGSWWETWRRAMRPAILRTQRLDTDHCAYLGSWDPIGPWGIDGGRVYATALMAMSLGVTSRYERVLADAASAK